MTLPCSWNCTNRFYFVLIYILFLFLFFGLYSDFHQVLTSAIDLGCTALRGHFCVPVGSTHICLYLVSEFHQVQTELHANSLEFTVSNPPTIPS